LNLLDEKRTLAKMRIVVYQQTMAKYFNARAKLRRFNHGPHPSTLKKRKKKLG
jgi:hypothetical protein